MSSSQTPVFHRYYDTDHLRPEFILDDAAAHRGMHGAPPDQVPAHDLPAPAESPAGGCPWHYLR